MQMLDGDTFDGGGFAKSVFKSAHKWGILKFVSIHCLQQTLLFPRRHIHVFQSFMLIAEVQAP
jgi:hypothetical protein